VVLPFPVPITAVPSIVTDLPSFITDIPSVVTDIASVVGDIPSVVTDIAAYLTGLPSILPSILPALPSPQLPPILPFPEPNGILTPTLGCECEQVFCIQSFPASCYCAAAAAQKCFQKCGGPRPPPANCGLLNPGGPLDGPVKARSAAPEPQTAPLPDPDDASTPDAPEPVSAPGTNPVVLNNIGPDSDGVIPLDLSPVYSLPPNFAAGVASPPNPAPLPPLPVLSDAPVASQPDLEPPVAAQPVPLDAQPIPILPPVASQPIPLTVKPIPILAPAPVPISAPINIKPSPFGNVKPRPGCACAATSCTQVYPESCRCANNNALKCFYRCGGVRPRLQVSYSLSYVCPYDMNRMLT
jgi:hypothetical protein